MRRVIAIGLFILGVHLINVDRNLRGIKVELNKLFDLLFSAPVLRDVLAPLEKLYFHKLPLSFFEYRFFIFAGFLLCIAWIANLLLKTIIRINNRK